MIPSTQSVTPTTQPKTATPIKSTTASKPVDTTPIFSFFKYTINSKGETVLEWDTKNMSSCTASGGWTGNQVVKGSKNVGKLVDGKKYTLTCKGVYSLDRSVTTKAKGI